MLKSVLVIFGVFLIQFCSCGIWSNLKLTWDLNPLKHFNSMPETEKKAIREGWTLISDCSKSKINGRKYMLKDDRSTILIFDNNGIRAGLATSLPKGLPYNVPSEKIQPYFHDEGDYYVISAYFIDPDTVCNSTSTDSDSYGDRLVIKGALKERNMPLTIEEVRNSTDWTEGPCMIQMGTHFWSNMRGRISEEMDSDDLFPVFLLYHRGVLNGFGWAFNADLESPRYEHPPKHALGKFFRPVPKYLSDPNKSGVISSIHVYLKVNPHLVFCKLFN